MGTSQYPRLGYPLAPRCLREVLDIPVPLSRVARTLSARLKYFELDERSWTHFPARRCKEFGQLIVKQTGEQIRSFPRKVLSRRLPALPAGIEVDDLDLEPRTRNRLQQMMSNARLASLDELRYLTVGQILCTDGLGAKCLVDLLTSLEGIAVYRDQTNVRKENGDHPAPKPLLDRRLSREAARLREIHDARIIRLDDPRLGKHLRQVFRFAASIEGDCKLTPQSTLLDLANRIASRPYDPANPVAFRGQMKTLRRYVGLMSRLPLETELRGIAAAVKKQRAVDMLLRYHGWKGSAPCTLHAAGAEFGVTGAAVSQICSDVKKVLSKKTPYVPSLDEALAFVRSSVPSHAGEIELALTQQGLTKETFRLESLLGAAKFFNRPAVFTIEIFNGVRLAIPERSSGLIRKIVRTAEKAMTHRGAARLENVTETAKHKPSFPVTSEFVSGVLELRGDFQRLDRENNWFWLSSVRNNPLVKLVRKVLSVSPRIDVNELLAGVSRSLRPSGVAFPREVLLEFCRRLPMCYVSGDTVAAAGSIDPSTTLCSSELLLLGILKAHGPLLKWKTYRALCLDAGMNQNTFSSVIRESPIIAKHGAGIYSIIGTDVPARLMEAPISERRQQTNRVRLGVAETKSYGLPAA